MRRAPVFQSLALAGAVLLSAGAFTPVRAQADPDDVKRAVARISLINGEVSVRRGDSGDWVAAAINAPLQAGDQITTGSNSRAEVQFDASNVLRIGDDAEIRFEQMEYERYQLQIARGTATYRVLRETNVDAEVDTPNISVRPRKKGTYRIAVNEAGETELTVRDGEVEVFTPTGTEWVRSGRSMIARGSSSDPEFRIANARPVDEWDRWNEDRDREELRSASYRHVPPGVYGVSDLDRHGRWVRVPDYGYCWEPTVGAGWAPYSSGRWVWSDWYGWTWVSYDPWGWAPYHYGRWLYRDRWYWYPGVAGRRHYWSPALVAFVGWGGGGIGFSFGNVGWVPLAPYETFHPWWGRHYYGRPGFINRNVNITNVNITNVYVNSRVRNGVIGVRRDEFESGRFNNIGRYSGTQIRQVGVVRGGIPIAPGRENLRFSDRQVTNPRTSPNTRFFQRPQRTPAQQTQRISFEQQRRAFEQAGMGNRNGGANPGREVAPTGGVQNRDVQRPAGRETFSGRDADAGGRQNGADVQRPAGRDVFTARPAQDNPSRNQDQPAAPGGWRRFNDRTNNGDRTDSGGRTNSTVDPGGERNGAPPAPSSGSDATPAQQNRGAGWQRFGTPGSGRQVNPRADEPAQPADRGGWNRFGNPGRETAPREQPAPQAQPERERTTQQERSQQPRFSAPRAERERTVRQPQQEQPRFSAPRERPSGPAMSAPRSEAPRAPRAAPSGGNRPAAAREAAPRSDTGSNNRSGGTPRNARGR